jgi:RNA polymerase sigma factor (sigma-70 family)
VVADRESDDLDLVMVARSGNQEAFGRLFDRWFDRTFDVAWRIVRNRDTAAEVAQDSFLAAWEQLGTLRRPESFGGWLLRIARNRALNRLERDRRSSPTGDDDTVLAVLDRRAGPGDIAADVADQERDQLIWAAAAALGERDTSLLDLHLRHDLDPADIADELGVAPNTVHQQLHRLRGRLAGAIRSWVLWHDGEERCPTLASVLTIARVTRFGPEAVRVISRHAGDCDVCSEIERAVLAPEALFAAVPLVAAPATLKAQAATGLAADGVPMGSAAEGKAPPASQSEAPGGSGEAPGEAPPAEPQGSQGTSGLSRRVAVGVAIVLAGLVISGTAVALRAGGAGNDDPVVATRATGADAGPDPEVGAGHAAPPTTTGGTTPSPGSSFPPTSVSTPIVGDPAPPPGGGGGGGTTTTTGSDPGAPPPGSITTVPPGGPVDPPVIGGFRATVQGACGTRGIEHTVVLAWTSTGGTSARLGLVDTAGSPIPTSGRVTICAVVGQTFLLTVTGDGGIDQATVTIAI